MSVTQSTAAAAITPTVVSSTSSTPRLEGDELVNSLKKQLEFYFSAENLANDAYLVSQMNAQKWVPIDVIANFRKVRTLTEDKEVLVRVMRQCKNVIVDDAATMVRPNVKNERNTLFLRDIPASTPETEIRAIFADEKVGGKVVSVRVDTASDMWFVTFESEDACTNWALELSSRTFQGKPIRSGVKSENMLRGFYYPGGAKQEGGVPSTTTTAAAPAAGRGQYRGQANGFYNIGGFPAATTAATTTTSAAATTSTSAASSTTPAYVPTWTPGFNKPADGDFYGRNNGAGRGTAATASTAATTPGSPGTPGGKRTKATKQPKRASGANGTGTPLRGGSDVWPALPTATKKEMSMSVGYTAEFVHYEKSQLAAIFNALIAKGTITRPATMPSASESVAVRSVGMTTCQLEDAMPVFFPASPSPVIAAQTAPFQSNMPFLDLSNSDAPPTAIPAPSSSASSSSSSTSSNSAKPAVSSWAKRDGAPSKAAPVAAKKKATPAAAATTASDAGRGRGGRGATRGGRGAATAATRGGRPASATTPTSAATSEAVITPSTDANPATAAPVAATTAASVVATAAAAAPAKGGKRAAAKKPVAATAAAAVAPAKAVPNPLSWSAKAAGVAGGVAPKPVVKATKVVAKQAAASAATTAAATQPAAAAPVATSAPTAAVTGAKLSYAEMARRAALAAEAAAKSS